MKLAIAEKESKNQTIDVSDVTFGREFNEALIHQVVIAIRAGQRAGTKKQKNRSDVSGGGVKPWRQKGTGRARAGTIRSPIWVGGGRTFAAAPRDHSQKINKKMYSGAMRSILSELARQERLKVVNSFNLEQPKTKMIVSKLKEMGLEQVLIVLHEPNLNVELAARNIPNVTVVMANYVNPINLLRYENVLMTVDAVRVLEEKLK